MPIKGIIVDAIAANQMSVYEDAQTLAFVGSEPLFGMNTCCVFVSLASDGQKKIDVFFFVL